MFYNRATWYLKFAWWPKRCDRSGKRIWLTRAYYGVVMFTGPGSPVFEYRWLTRDEFIMGKLRGTL